MGKRAIQLKMYMTETRTPVSPPKVAILARRYPVAGYEPLTGGVGAKWRFRMRRSS
jgi:hypothetical protein